MYSPIEVNGKWYAESIKGHIFNDFLGKKLELFSEESAINWCDAKNSIDHPYTSKGVMIEYMREQKAKREKDANFWDNKRDAMLHAQMDNQSMCEWTTHESY
jgi:hypothetical protein